MKLSFKPIEVIPYDPAWPQMFEQEAKIIKQALGPHCQEIHHVGSTSVPGLSAKPIIDILAVVKRPLQVIAPLEKAGFQYKGEYNIPLHYGFAKHSPVRINLHAYEEGHPEIELNVLFRDHLCLNFQAREGYALLKKKLLEDDSSFLKLTSSFSNYTLRKGDFIRRVLKEAGFKRLRALKCNDETEWQSAKYLRTKYFFSPHNIEDPYTWTFNHPDHAHLILYEGTEIIGYAHIQFWPENRAALRIIVIEEDKRNTGAGSMFLTFCEKWLKSLRIKTLHVESRLTSLQFYRKLGYLDMPFNDPEGHESDPQDIPLGKVL